MEITEVSETTKSLNTESMFPVLWVSPWWTKCMVSHVHKW